MISRRQLTYNAIGAIPFLGMSSGCKPSSDLFRFTGTSMGTSYRIAIVKPPRHIDFENVTRTIFADIENTLSNWRSDSWVSNFNKQPANTVINVPSNVRLLFQQARTLHRETDGLFDITCFPLVSLWGFGPLGHDYSNPPSSDVIQTHLSKVGFEKLVSTDEFQTISKAQNGVTLDFSAIAKGYAVDLLADHFLNNGVNSFIIELGGDLRAHGHPPEHDAWRIREPNSEKPILINDEAIATSGPEHHSRDDICHLINPISGMAIAASSAVTLKDKTCTRADALATAKAIQISQTGLSQRNQI